MSLNRINYGFEIATLIVVTMVVSAFASGWYAGKREADRWRSAHPTAENYSYEVIKNWPKDVPLPEPWCYSGAGECLKLPAPVAERVAPPQAKTTFYDLSRQIDRIAARDKLCNRQIDSAAISLCKQKIDVWMRDEIKMDGPAKHKSSAAPSEEELRRLAGKDDIQRAAPQPEDAITSFTGFSKRCEATVNFADGWLPVVSAPRDGTVIEMAETYGVATWYGLFAWKNEWKQMDEPDRSVMEDNCLFWRPYKGDVAHYVDPTNGAQKTVKYECDAMGVRYDPNKDRCVQ